MHGFRRPPPASRVAGDAASTAAIDREGAALFRDVYDVEVRTGVLVQSLDAHRRNLFSDGALGTEYLLVRRSDDRAHPSLLNADPTCALLRESSPKT